MIRQLIFLALIGFAGLQAQWCNFNCYDGCTRANFYVGGNFLYSITNLPQNIITSEYETFARQPSLFGSGKEVITQRTSRENTKWNIYAGYEQPLCSQWLIGAEVGYRNLGKMKTHYIGPLTLSQEEAAIENLTFYSEEESSDEARFCCSGSSKDPKPFRNVRSCAVDGLLTLRYQTCNGFNLFAKGGFAWIHMHLRDGNFYEARNPQISFLGPLAPQSFNYYNIYPELVFGGGYRWNNWLNFTVSYGHIYGPKTTARYVQRLLGDSEQILARPNQAPSYDFITVGVDLSLLCL